MDKNIAEKLFLHRKANGLSQEELAEKIGVSRQAVSKWERGETSPDTENLIALAKLYSTSLDKLVFGEMANENNEYMNSQDNSIVQNSTVTNKSDVEVKISPSVIQITDKNGHIFHTKKPVKTKTYHVFEKFPYAILTVIAYILFGYFDICGGWGLGWLVFLTVPLYHSLITAIARRDASNFAYPVLVVMIYLYIGMANSLWHPGWVIFLTIPVYYFLAELIKKSYRNS